MSNRKAPPRGGASCPESGSILNRGGRDEVGAACYHVFMKLPTLEAIFVGWILEEMEAEELK